MFCGCNNGKVKQVWIYNDADNANRLNVSVLEKLNGNVKEIYTGDSLSQDNFYHVNVDYNGNVINSTISSVDNRKRETLKIAYRYKYKNGKKSSIIEDWRGKFNWSAEWVLDGAGQILNCSCKYDNSGNLTEWEQVYHIVTDLYRYKYNNQNRIVESILYNDGLPLVKKSYQYIAFDRKGNWTKKIVHEVWISPMKSYSSIDTLIRKITYH
jgi:hypothetical protein